MAIPDQQARLGYCHMVLLPIWERWAAGDPAMRRFLECPDAERASREELLHHLIRAAGALRRPDWRGARTDAAWFAAAACLQAYMGVSERVWQQALERALAADREAGAAAAGDGSLEDERASG